MTTATYVKHNFSRSVSPFPALEPYEHLNKVQAAVKALRKPDIFKLCSLYTSSYWYKSCALLIVKIY